MKKLLALLLSISMLFLMACTTSAAAIDQPGLTSQQAESSVTSSTQLADNVLANAKSNIYLGSWDEKITGHIQGFCTDDVGQYLYATFTYLLVKVDMRTGEVVGTVTLHREGHLGDLTYHEGKVYGSLMYDPYGRFFVAVFDCDKIKGDMHYTDESVMSVLYLANMTTDWENNLAGNEHNNSAASMGHRYGLGGIDGMAFGTLPGKGYTTANGFVPDDKTYLIVATGTYSNSYNRYDNENYIFLVYDPDEITSDNLIPFTTDLLTTEYTKETSLFYKHKMFCYVGNFQYGVQVLNFDKTNGNYLIESYERNTKSEFYVDGAKYQRYVIDGSVPLYLDTVEVGQSVTGDKSGFLTQAKAHEMAACYTDYEDVDGDGDYDEQETGWHMTLKCVCGEHDNISEHTAVAYGETGYAIKLCGTTGQKNTGARLLGSDASGNKYFYAVSNYSGETIEGIRCETAYVQLYKILGDDYSYEEFNK